MVCQDGAFLPGVFLDQEYISTVLGNVLRRNSTFRLRSRDARKDTQSTQSRASVSPHLS